MNDFEKLGAFYIGKNYDINTKSVTDDLVLYDSKDLTTHAVCVGMTGSGKTGLCISILEEAAIDNIPAICIDPKGDITNLLLTFPNLLPSDFQPWINKSDAEKKGLSEEEFAANQAELWEKGLQQWGQDGSRIAMMKENAGFNIYTPGSSSGLQISILDSFKAPSKELIDDSDLFNDKISSTASSLLGLLGIDADPLTSKEHILLSNILSNFWLQQKDLDLPTLIQKVQKPPFEKIGVFDLETFYSEKDRMNLAMLLNNILSAPGFQTWLNGHPLDIDKLLYDDSGKPQISIFYTAHLSDNERMFFTSLLLNQFLGWMRSQSGTTSLRALLYVDEIFGYLPPVANPPSKKAFLTLLKQARAFGVGLILATQNPVDLDYKSLSNAGTWFLGRLQTDQDKKRVLDGLEGAISSGGGNFNRDEITKLLSNLDKRVFLLHNVHEDHPILFQTRWAMSYLRGPLTRNQIKMIVQDNDPQKINTVILTETNNETDIVLNIIPNEIKPLYLKRDIPDNLKNEYLYKPHLISKVKIKFIDRTKKIDYEKDVLFITQITNEIIPVKWDRSIEPDYDENLLSKTGDTSIKYSLLPKVVQNYKNFSNWERSFDNFLTNDFYIELFYHPESGYTSEPNETLRDFKIRLSQLTREYRDTEIQKLKEKYSRRIQTVQNKIQRAEERISREKSQASQHKLQTAISIGSTILGSIFGRKTFSSTTIGKAGTAMRSAGRTMQQTQDVKRAEENLEQLNIELADIQDKLEEELNLLKDKLDSNIEQIQSIKIRPKKTNIIKELFNFVWVPLCNNENLNDLF